MTRRVLGIAAAIVLLIVVVLWWRSCHHPAAAEETNVEVSVQVAKAERGTIAREVTAVATLVAQRDVFTVSNAAVNLGALNTLAGATNTAGRSLSELPATHRSSQWSILGKATRQLDDAVVPFLSPYRPVWLGLGSGGDGSYAADQMARRRGEPGIDAGDRAPVGLELAVRGMVRRCLR